MHLHLFLSGWFDISVTLTEDMQNQTRETSDKVTELETLQWCDISTPFPAADNISDYIASDEESDTDDKEVEDICCLTPIQSDEECQSSSPSSEVDFDDPEEEFWFSSLAPQFMGTEGTQFELNDSEVPGEAFAQSSNSFWRPLESPGYQGLVSISDVEGHGGAWDRDQPPEHSHQSDGDYQCEEAVDVAEGLRHPHSSDGGSNHNQHNSHHSDSEGSDVHSTESGHVSTLKQFKHDVMTLLNLLMDEKFAHPYGTIAGSVA